MLPVQMILGLLVAVVTEATKAMGLFVQVLFSEFWLKRFCFANHLR